jgi:hypothetical protein
MNSIRAIIRELTGLFVDDGSFALAIVAWILGCALCIALGTDPVFEALLLFAGLAFILAENVWRSARRARSGS